MYLIYDWDGEIINVIYSWNRNSVCNCSYSRTADHMCREDTCAHLSLEEQIAAEESLSIYCKPVELYNILQRRAVRNVMFFTVYFCSSSFLIHICCGVNHFSASKPLSEPAYCPYRCLRSAGYEHLFWMLLLLIMPI